MLKEFDSLMLSLAVIALLLACSFIGFGKYTNSQDEQYIAPIIEAFTSYEDVTDISTDKYDIYVHETSESKEIEFYPKTNRVRIIHYYRIKPDLSYHSVPKEQKSFGHDSHQ